MNIIIVFVSGVAGGLTRMEINDLTPKLAGFPVGTLLINMLGCFAFGLVVKHYMVVRRTHERVVLAVGTGFIGTFTTFSSALTDTLTLAEAGQTGLATLYLLLEIVGGLLMLIAGVELGRRVIQP